MSSSRVLAAMMMVALWSCTERAAPAPVDGGMPRETPQLVDAGVEVEGVDAGTVETPPVPVEGPDAGLLWVQGTFRVAGGGAEGIVSLHERGPSDRCEEGTGPERTTTGVATSVRPKRQATVQGFVRFVFAESQRAKLPANAPLCVRYFNGSTQWFLVRDEDFIDDVLELGTFSVRGAPSIRRVASVGPNNGGVGTGFPQATIDSSAVEKRMELIAELEKTGDAVAVKRERSRLLEEFGTDDSYAFDRKLKPNVKNSLGRLCRSGCSAEDKQRLDFAHGLPGL